MDPTVIAALIGGGSSLTQSGMNFGFNAAATKRQYHWQRDLMNLQNELQKDYATWNLQNSASLTRQGLESAGYNPILAVSNGLSNASGSIGLGSASTGTAQAGDLASGITNAYQAFKLAREKNTAEVNATNASASLAQEQAKTEEFKRRQMESQTFLNNIDHQLKSKELSWYDKQSLMNIRTGYINAQANQLSAQASASNAHTAKMGYELNKEVQYWNKNLGERQNKWHADHKYQTDWQYGLGRWKQSLPNVNVNFSKNF